MYRAERLDGNGKVEGWYCGHTYDGVVMYCKESAENVNVEGCSGLVEMFIEIKPETLEIYLFGEWRLVSELEKPCEWKCVKLESNEFILYDTKCDESNIWLDESVEKLGYKFCPYCGRPIKEI